ncbi:hypothetical protein EVAR_92851_1 [Eumeta japonica]|uniref:Uncharacterized protein n=1 Tax=Eumeta variegata TaxID=151549 RepID=A0A4C1TCL5_EUMVA|nr:hypothetical protein EVAR_92851_1 [Eumeta japonica]
MRRSEDNEARDQPGEALRPGAGTIGSVPFPGLRRLLQQRSKSDGSRGRIDIAVSQRRGDDRTLGVVGSVPYGVKENAYPKNFPHPLPLNLTFEQGRRMSAELPQTIKTAQCQGYVEARRARFRVDTTADTRPSRSRSRPGPSPETFVSATCFTFTVKMPRNRFHCAARAAALPWAGRLAVCV